MTRCTRWGCATAGSDNWQATRGAQLSIRIVRANLRYVYDTCAPIVYTLPPSLSLSLSLTVSLSRSLCSPVDIYQAKAHGLLIHIRNCVTVCRPRVSVCVSICVSVSFFFSAAACAGVRSGCGQAVSCGSTQPLKSESSVPQLSQQRQRARARSAKVNQFLQNIRATN